MQGKIYEIPLDISSGVLTSQIRELVTEDMGTNTFRFKVVRDNHVPYDFAGTIVRMMVKTPSGARIQQECTIENAVGGTVSLTLKQSLLLEHGLYIAELQIFDAITQSIRLTTPTFNYHVRQSLQNSESIVATDEYTILQEALADLAGINIVVANKADKSDVGDLEYLETEGKTNIVAAINEVKSQSNHIATDVETHKAESVSDNAHGLLALNDYIGMNDRFIQSNISIGTVASYDIDISSAPVDCYIKIRAMCSDWVHRVERVYKLTRISVHQARLFAEVYGNAPNENIIDFTASLNATTLSLTFTGSTTGKRIEYVVSKNLLF